MADTSDCLLCERHRTTGIPQTHRYHWTAAMQAAVVLASRQGYGAVKRLWRTDPQFAALPYHAVQRSSQTLGVAKHVQPSVWSAAEEQVLDAHGACAYPLLTWQKLLKRHGFTRSLGAIQVRLRLRGWSSRQGEWALNEVAQGFGVDYSVVVRWVAQGLLPVTTTSTVPKAWRYVTTKALRQMLAVNPSLAGTGTPDVPWLVSLLVERGIGRTHETPDQDDESGAWMTGNPVRGIAAAD